jgi:hypothetical protein
MLRHGALPPVACCAAVRCFSEARSATSWPNERGTLPERNTPHPHRQLHIARSRTDWRVIHGHGARLGHMGRPREIPDWEFADGTPAPHNSKRHAFEFHKHHLLYQFIEAGAEVESRAAQGKLPIIPSTTVQRDWDPNVPLFLEDVDERGARPSVFRQFVAPQAVSSQLSTDLEPKERELQPAVIEGFEPSELLSEERVSKTKKTPPFWNKRLWALTNEFLMKKPTRNPNALGQPPKKK